MQKHVIEVRDRIKATLLGASMVKAYTKNDSYYIDARFFDEISLTSRIITVHADWEMMKLISDCLPFLQAFCIHAVVVQGKSAYLVKPPEDIELPIIIGKIKRSKIIGGPCIFFAEDAKSPDHFFDDEDKPDPDPHADVY